jgi:hypothetical protein
LEGVLLSLGDVDSTSKLLALGIEVADCFHEGASNLLLEMGQSLYYQ